MNEKAFLLQLLMPGTQEEMGQFQEDAVSSSKVHVECTFPRLDVNLHTKDVFENIYNRYENLFNFYKNDVHCLDVLFSLPLPPQAFKRDIG